VGQFPLDGGGQESAANWTAPEIADASAEDVAAFETALSNAQPGDTVTLPAGRYAGDFTATADGTAEAPIIFQAATGARVVIDGSLTLNGDYVQCRNIEATYSSWTTRVSAQSGSAPSDIPLTKCVTLNGVGTKLVNCVVRDTANAVGVWASAADAELYGCLVYNTGWYAPDGGHGHAVYTQSDAGTKRLRNCIFAQGYSNYGIHAYTQGGFLTGFLFEDVVNYPPRFLVGGYTPVDDLTIRRAYLYGMLNLGFSDIENGSAVLEDVTAAGALGIVGDWGVANARITQTGSRFNAAGLNEVHIKANEYDDDRAQITIYNAAQVASIDLDLSALPLTVGREYVLRHAQKYDEGYAFTYTGAAVTLPLVGWGVAVPVGADGILTGCTLPAWGTFLLEPA
jgi:hypothetical protein